MKKVLIGILVAVALIAAIAVGGIALGLSYVNESAKNPIPEKATVTENGYGTITAVGRGLYDQKGDLFEIKGINFGNLFISEGWMTTNSIGPLLNNDGSFKNVNEEGIVVDYEEIYQEEMDKILAERFTPEQIKALNDAYFYSYCTEADFQLIKDMKLNTIRLPMYYRNFMEGDDSSLVMRDDAFEKLDYFLDLAKKYDLKVIIDMHGVVGGQSGYEHSGTRDIDFWDNETYIESMCTLWKNIATHYVDERPDLASTILAYDLVNEPTNKNEIGTGRKQWDVMNRLYEAIRAVDKHHVISIEGVWYPTSLPNPEEYGWENVLYQYHFYNWNQDKGISNDMFYGLQLLLYRFSDYDVPKMVGEFNFFADKEAWAKYLDVYDKLGWGWTIWSYKIVSVGWWDSSWGVAVNKLNLKNSSDTPIDEYNLKLDIRTASYEEILESWSDQKTEYGTQEGAYKIHDDGVLYKVINDYFAGKEND